MKLVASYYAIYKSDKEGINLISKIIETIIYSCHFFNNNNNKKK